MQRSQRSSSNVLLLVSFALSGLVLLEYLEAQPSEHCRHGGPLNRVQMVAVQEHREQNSEELAGTEQASPGYTQHSQL